MSNFRVGQKVVCLDDEGSDGDLSRGRVYTITKINGDVLYSARAKSFSVGLELLEAHPSQGFHDFAASRFRPVVERKTDISIFKAMLNTKPEMVGA